MNVPPYKAKITNGVGASAVPSVHELKWKPSVLPVPHSSKGTMYARSISTAVTDKAVAMSL